MSLIVCKFGGTSVASPERIKKVAQRLVMRRQEGHQVVAVVSAMGKTTDELVGLAAALNSDPPAREMDRLLSTGEQVSMTLLAMAIEARGYKDLTFDYAGVFSQMPAVIPILGTVGATNANYGSISLNIVNRTISSCTVRVHNSGTGTVSPTVRVWAFGLKA